MLLRAAEPNEPALGADVLPPEERLGIETLLLDCEDVLLNERLGMVTLLRRDESLRPTLLERGDETDDERGTEGL